MTKAAPMSCGMIAASAPRRELARIEQYVAILTEAETIHPQQRGPPAEPRPTPRGTAPAGHAITGSSFRKGNLLRHFAASRHG
jgi:hypothetical protein